MLLLFSISVAVRPLPWERCLFGLLCVSIMNVYHCASVCYFFPIGFEGGVWHNGHKHLREKVSNRL